MRKEYSRNRDFRSLGVALLVLASLAVNVEAQIGPPPLIAVQPLGVSVLNGDSATFLVVAVSVTKASYQWRLNGVGIPGATQSSYTRANVTSADEGKYSVVIQNAAGSVTSADALLVLLAAPVTTPLSIILSGLTSVGINLQLSGPAGSNYVVMASSDLQTWTPISTNAAPSGTVNFTDSSAAKYPRRFYKGLVQ